LEKKTTHSFAIFKHSLTKTTLTCQDCLKHKLNQSIQHPMCPERKREKTVVIKERWFNG